MEDECVGKDLLERGGIKRHVMLIPLNKIYAFKLSAAHSITHPRFPAKASEGYST
jgi:hypothetical protein